MGNIADVLVSVLPIFLLLVIGNLLRRNQVPSEEYWAYADKLVYWLLFPALLFFKTSTITLSAALLGPFVLVLLGGFAASLLFSLLLQGGMRLQPAAYSSVMQGALRHNTFIALAIAERLLGAEGLALAALATSVLVPATNVTVVTGMLVLLRPGGQRRFGAMLVKELLRNPLIVAIALGVLVNLTGVGRIPVLHDTTRLLGDAALPMVLLCVGASLRIRAMRASLAPFLASAGAKMLVFPVVIGVLARVLGLDGTAAQVAVLYGAVPTASSGYALARQMGGDAPLMASIITLQTLLSLVTLPLSSLLAAHFLV